MKITVDHIISNIIFKDNQIDPGVIIGYAKRDMMGALSNELLKYPKLFEETKTPFNDTKLKVELVVLGMDTFNDICVILREQAHLSDYWKKQLKCLFSEKI